MTRSRGRLRRTSLAASLAAVALSLAGAGAAPAGTRPGERDDELRALVARVSEYVAGFRTAFAGIVAEEDYRQAVRAWVAPPREPTDGSQLLSRRLRSDVLMLHASDTPWMMHRDVFEVDGRPVRDREARLEALFLSPEADDVAQLRRIALESARFNLGDVERTINLPTFGLLVAHPAYIARFKFEDGGTAAFDGQTLALVRFRETGRPTLVRDRGTDVPLRGALWVDRASGAVMRTEVEPSHRTIRSAMRVTFRHDASLGANVPVEMWDWFHGGRSTIRDGVRTVSSPSGSLYVEGLATYSRFRKFRVTTVEDVR